MAKKKHNRSSLAQAIQTPKASTKLPDQDGSTLPEAQPALDLSKGNTADMRHMFADALGDDNEILNQFPTEWKDPILVLKSIHGNELSLETRRTVWGKPVLAFRVAIAALDDTSVFARLDVELLPGYPKIPPTIRLDELTPDTDALRQGIKTTIAECERLMKDDEYMISSILQGVQERLDDTHADIQQRAQGTSLEEERVIVETAALETAAIQQKVAQDQEALEAAAKEEKLAKDVEAHRRRRQVLSSGQSAPEDSTSAGEEYPDSCVIFDQDMRLKDTSLDFDLHFRAVQPMSILYRRKEKLVSIACPFRAGKTIPLELVLKEVRLPSIMETRAEYEDTLRTIENALQEVESYEHASIVKIYGHKLLQAAATTSEPHWEIFILTEKAQQSLFALLAMAGSVNAAKIRTFTRSMLDALEYYDRKGYVHPAIHAHNILLFSSETGAYSAKLSDGYGTTLRNLVEKIQKSQSPDLRHGNWAAPEVIDGTSARNNKTCIWELGVVLLQMALGNDMTNKYTSPEDALSQAGFDQDFDHLVSKMCSTSSRKRPTAFQLHSFQFFKSHIDSVFRSEARPSKTTITNTKSHSSVESRWASEWEPIEKLGKGGFGTVFKARHRVDGYLYAVKELKCRSMRDTEDIWGEVRMLAQLNHPAIVRYFLAWSEEDQEFTDTDTSMSHTDPRSFAPPTDSHAPRSSLFAAPSTGHDFMDPSLAQLSDIEAADEDQEEDSSSISSRSGGLFGYQSAPSDSDAEESQALVFEDEDDSAEPSDPFGLQVANNDIDDQPDFFGRSDENDRRQITNVPSRPQTFVLAKGTPSALRRPPQYYNKSSTLYIQMELCETGTLFDLIRGGLPDRVDEAWRIFRLVLDGLDYIHERGIVHRDLKPMNIFIDSQRMPKIGDFGLASASQANTDGHKIATHVAGPMSRGVGTVFYIAPELEDSKQAGKYSNKADMFALGIIFFEMCFPFKTSTERINWLRSINDDGAQELPKRFEKDEYRIQGRIIKSLLCRDAASRPSAKDLMLDPEVPEPLEEDKEKRYFQRLMQGDPQQLRSVMKNFMARQATKAQSLAYSYCDEESITRPDSYLQFHIQQKLSEVFTSHGAVETQRGTAFPVEGLYPNAVKFLDEAGFTVQLPYDLTVPFARHIAVQRPEYEKSFCFGTVFRQRKEQGTEPICMPEADFDVVSYSARDLSLKDAQTISVLDDCLTKLAPLFMRSFSIIVSHGDLLDLILRACEVSETRLDDVKRILSNLNVAKTTWKQIEPQLRSLPVSLPVTTLIALHQFDFSTEFTEMRNRVLDNLKKFKKVDLATKATRTLNRLQELDDYLKRLQVRVQVLYSPLSNTSEFLYHGSTMFKCVESKTSKAVFVGGRYDALIRDYQTPTHQTFARAVGFRINVVDLALYARNDAQRMIAKSNKTKVTMPANIPSRVDIVVASFDESTLYNACIEIVRNILDAGLSAELAGSFSSMEELEQAYAIQNRYWTVIVRPSGSKIKVRSPSKEEVEVTSSDLISHLREEIGDKNATGVAEPVLRRTRSSHGASERENVTVLTPQHKSKKVNRAAIVDSARSAAQDLTEHMSKTCKILAIDTDDETLQKLRNTRLADSESWRSLRHSVNLTDRDYVQEIQQQLQDWCDAGQDGAFLCNFKTKRCIFYDFGRS